MLPHAKASSGRILGVAALVAAALLLTLSGLVLQAEEFDPVGGLKTKSAEEGDETYEVVSGDTLYDIAARFLGDGDRWPEIFEANKDQIDNPNLIYPGQKFKIPGGAKSGGGRRKGSPGAPDDSGGDDGQRGGREGAGRVEGFERLPLNHSGISSPFGPRRSPCAGCSSFHKGIDLRGSRGTPVYAVGPGRCTRASFESGGGNTIVIDHGGGYSSYYLHLQQGSMKIRPGDRVAAGQHIANVNNTGAYTTGDHLHFAVSKNGTLIDPQNVMKIPQGW